MPELPEVEVVRRGLADHVVGRTLKGVEVLHHRSVRRHAAGMADFRDRLEGVRVLDACRRGKYLWFPLDSGEALLAHLGMSGQLLVCAPEIAPQKHLRVSAGLVPEGATAPATQLRFVDQRTFGHMLVDEVGPGVGGRPVPLVASHIAADPLEPAFDDAEFARALTNRRSGVKRALLDQSLVSGVGNIYADEALWRTGLHGEQPAGTLTRADVKRLLVAVRDVLEAALDEGGTSFDGLYVNVNGESGYFSRALRVYGREGQRCGHCGTPIVREVFMNRSSFRCPRCQSMRGGED
ncbi:bifunctional DNA-formamidopyrimidine glycosylase/DNA-(apurinic or apyrimidinic site) lyase [Spiractinospora alimapuensis]|uniref:bifunctional DNA-formamidopyrimidine glycosylase/DNA-(apurinic or apyrimidinic site) lyase n=1 Tax=Spiractinospora alimapuensis TaxID=2820884 RepID=UPI001EEA0A7D|nr:bifunctional DNA-formamidopyrimidine glycosylase/DNA-(apurinic or apyrimidinic site) lyase [Spiractinospora alimapuensis]QVQ51666.1 bifunctional DNA-formamidopyrimidine glycosylase/DNA-(apurinic or apyrimidinic site) lyase [Spiractinospora alimapuensis]